MLSENVKWYRSNTLSVGDLIVLTACGGSECSGSRTVGEARPMLRAMEIRVLQLGLLDISGVNLYEEIVADLNNWWPLM